MTGEELKAYWQVRLRALAGDVHWLNALIALERQGAGVAKGADDAIRWSMNGGVMDLAPEHIAEAGRRLDALVEGDARVAIFDARYRVLLLQGTVDNIRVKPLRDVAPGAYPDDVLALDGFGARLEFKLAERPIGMPDPGIITVDVLTVLKDEPSVWEATGPRHRIRLSKEVG